MHDPPDVTPTQRRIQCQGRPRFSHPVACPPHRRTSRVGFKVAFTRSQEDARPRPTPLVDEEHAIVAVRFVDYTVHMSILANPLGSRPVIVLIKPTVSICALEAI